MGAMNRVLLLLALLQMPLFSPVLAAELAPRITDKEIIERLTRLEEGQKALRAAIFSELGVLCVFARVIFFADRQ